VVGPFGQEMTAVVPSKPQPPASAVVLKDPNANKRRYQAFKRLFGFCRPEALRLTVGFTALGVNSVTNLSFPWLMKRSLDQVNADNFPTFLWKSAALLAAGSLASWVRVYCLGTATDSISARLRKDLFESYLDKDMEYFDSAKSGELISLIDEDVKASSEVFTERLAAGLRATNSAVNGSIILYTTSPRLTCVALSVIPLVGVGAMFLARFSGALTKKLRALQSDILSYSLERVSNIATVKLNCREQYEKEKYAQYMAKSSALSNSRYNAHGGFMSFINLSTNLSLLAVLREGGKLLAEGKLTAGDLVGFAMQVQCCAFVLAK
jgi:ABC-type multidrug transport system fused ATPase/permease subunit